MIMTELHAKPVLKNKFWIVESNGSKIATIQAVENGGYVFVQDQARTTYSTIKLLTKAHNIILDKDSNKNRTTKSDYDVYGYPVTGKPWNVLWDVRHKFPIYTKSSKSKSFFCAGYYLIKFNNGWVKSYCPKLITLNRNEFKGPFYSKEEMAEQLKATNGY